MGHSKQSSKQEPSLPIRELLVGVWALKTYTDTHTGTSELQPFGNEPAGLLIYTADGFVSAQLMQPGRKSSHPGLWSNWSAEEFKTFGDGYIGYCGRYEVDEEHATVTHLPSVAFLPNFVGQRLLREVSFTDNRLTLKASYALPDGSTAASLLEWTRFSTLRQS